MRRVVITGLGVVAPNGLNVAAFWNAIRHAESGIGPLQGLSCDLLNTPIAAQVKGFDPKQHLSYEQISRLDRFAQFALIAGLEAIRDARLEFERDASHRCGVILGSGIGGIETLDESFQRLFVRGIQRMNPVGIAKIMMNSAASAISMALGITGPCFMVSSACSSANHAIAQAFWMLRGGLIDIAITGGCEAPLTQGHMKAWESLRLVAPDTCRPFCADRKGLVLGEGAGILVLETLEHAQARQSKAYAELAGCGLSADACDLMHPAATGAIQAMRLALEDANLLPGEIDYINAHGTGTWTNDLTETEAIRRLFGAHAARIAVSSTKSMHGHALGATGGLEAVATIQAIAHGLLPPTANFTRADPKLDLDFVPNQARACKIRAALSNSFAFGGLNAVLAFKQMPGDRIT